MDDFGCVCHAMCALGDSVFMLAESNLIYRLKVKTKNEISESWNICNFNVDIGAESYPLATPKVLAIAPVSKNEILSFGSFKADFLIATFKIKDKILP